MVTSLCLGRSSFTAGSPPRSGTLLWLPSHFMDLTRGVPTSLREVAPVHESCRRDIGPRAGTLPRCERSLQYRAGVIPRSIVDGMLGPERVRYLAARDRSSTERVSYLALVGRSTLHSSRAGASVDVDEYGWTVVGTFNLWEQGISLDANQPCIRKWKHWDGRWRICFNTQHARASEWTVRS
ncbi:hypothetical protein F2Q70_00038272 [Brassica cretica]|uniref:DUF4440 domain-containing protein n=1 Tax=Brassica cretica TaxID=69181 RepID=A0A8S9K7Z5_BRACR|nr:hypothetical protein F2Q70_00038272 [Brassica cretica]